jgi:predicted PurR-regulated permease PerM
MAHIANARVTTAPRMKEPVGSFDDAPAEPQRSHDLRSIRRAVTVIAVVTCAVVLYVAQAILVPTALGIILALILSPMVVQLEKLRVPTAIASVLVVLMAVALIAGIVAVARPAVESWIENAPQISRTVEEKFQPIRNWLASFEAASNRLEKLTKVGPPAAAVVTAPDAPGSILETAPTALAQAFYVIALALFLINVRKVYRKRLILLSSNRGDRLRVARIMNESLQQVSQYLFVLMCVGFGVAAVTTVCFAIAGIDNPLFWGTVFGIGSLIPYIGPTAVILVCALVQFALQPTLAEAAVGPLILLAINTVEANFVTPLLVSRRTAVSAIAIFVTIAVFVWLWGPVASIVAVPLLVLFNAVAKHVPSLQPYAVLLQAENSHPDEIGNAARFQFFSENGRRETWLSQLRALAQGK